MNPLLADISDPSVDALALLAAIRATDGEVRVSCLSKIQAMLSSPDPAMRRSGAELASQLQLPPEAVPALEAALDDPDPKVRFGAAWALVRLGPGALRALDGLVRRFKDDEIPVRDRAAWAVSNIGAPAVETLLTSMTSPDVATRALSTYCLSNIAGIDRRWPESLSDERARELAPAFFSALGDPNPWVQITAVGGLKTLMQRFVVPVFVGWLHQSDQHWREQGALELFWASPRVTEEAARELERCSDDQNERVRSLARDALGRMGRVKDDSADKKG